MENGLLYCLSFITLCTWLKVEMILDVFSVLHKAFDTLPHQPLLKKLEETGLNQHLLRVQ